jgi:hypothetical protein
MVAGWRGGGSVVEYVSILSGCGGGGGCSSGGGRGHRLSPSLPKQSYCA